MELKDRIRECRLNAKMTQAEVGEHIGVKKQTIQKYESGEVSNIPYEKLVALGEVFGVSPAYFFTDTVEKADYSKEFAYFVNKIKRDKKMRDFVIMFDKLSEDQKTSIYTIVEGMAKNNQ